MIFAECQLENIIFFTYYLPDNDVSNLFIAKVFTNLSNTTVKD